MQTSFNKFSPSSVTAFAKLCVVNPELAMNAIRALSDAEDLLSSLHAHPGALEKLLRAENCSRYIKSSIEVVLEERGEFILS